MLITLLLVVTFCSALIDQSTGLHCPSECTCIQRTVRCIRNHLTEIPDVPKDTVILDLRFNEIQEIPSNAFEGLSRLHTIFLSENQIELIHEDAFSGLTALKYLYLNDNRISRISPSAFQGLNQLQSLFLVKNKLTEIPEGLFSNLSNLQRLRLNNNPIKCDCGVYSLLKEYKGGINRSGTNTDKGAMVFLECASPQNLQRMNFENLKENDFHCQKPEIVEEPEDMKISLGNEIEIPCKVKGDPKPDIFWMRDSNMLSINDKNPKIKILPNGNLQIISITENDIATYECMGKNSLGEVRSRPIRIVTDNHLENDLNDRNKLLYHINSANNNDDNNNNNNTIPSTYITDKDEPRFIYPPRDVTVTTNEPIILNCMVSGNPTPLVTWSFNGRKLSKSTKQTQIHSNGTLVLLNPRERNSGAYRCEATNTFGSIYKDIKVQVNASRSDTNRTTELPEIILSPESQTVKSGTSLILECDADGEPQPRISWKRNGIVLEPASTSANRITLQNENTELQIEHIKESDSGRYTCVAENENGVTEATAEINVTTAYGPPRLIFEPYDMEVLPGVTLEIPCKGEGEQTPQVKWHKDGRSVTIIPGKYQISSTGSLFVKNVSLADGGRYECSITNEYGRATAQGVITVRGNDVLSPGDRYVHIAFDEAMKEIDSAINHTMEMLFKNRKPSDTTLNHGDLFHIFRYPTGEARQLARAAELYERTLVNIRKHIEAGENLTMESEDFQYKDLLSREHLHLIAELSGCMEHREHPNCTDMCFHSKYRSIDGTCNNLHKAAWGSSLIGFRRLIKPEYENGFSMPIGWTKGKLYNGFPIPSARLISTQIISTKEITPDEKITHMVMQWGQFLDHDLDHAIPSVSSESWDGVDCKKTCEYAAPCYPIEVPPNDPRVNNRRCIDLVRSSAICGSGMTSVFFESVQPREQINQLTSYIDGSQVYGYSYQFAQELRNLSSEDGLLRTGVNFPNQKEMLPFAAPQDGIDCRRKLEESNINCFVAGDIRVNEQTGLLAMHVIWMREHNRIARKLKEINPHWDGDTLYEESRKIVGAQMQHITFKQWLPIIIGEEGMQKLGEYKEYDPSVDPTISNEFATAALRFGHSLINPILHRLNETYQPIPQGHLQLHKAFFSPWRLVYEGGVDPLMRGMFTMPAKLKLPGQNLNTELTEKLFHNSHAVALDLAAINIQRGREHGIPSYNKYREFCNMTVAEKFDDLKNEISSIEIRNKLKELYGHPSNIDVWVGGILEDQVEGGKVGPLFRCLLIEQFRRLRDGDRFYYENPTVFMPEQLLEIKRANLGRILCDNGDNITEVTENIFILPKHQGGYKKCEDISGINLYFWQDCGTCNSLPPLLKSYVPQTYQKTNSNGRNLRRKRSLSNNNENHDDGHQSNEIKDNSDEDLLDMNEERVSGLEEVISSFQKELKKMKKKLKKLEQSCNANGGEGGNRNNNNNNRQHPHHHCQDASGNRRLNYEVWTQDECTKCQCKYSEVTCITERCGQVTCPNNAEAVKYPGDCCAQCPRINISKEAIGAA